MEEHLRNFMHSIHSEEAASISSVYDASWFL